MGLGLVTLLDLEHAGSEQELPEADVEHEEQAMEGASDQRHAAPPRGPGPVVDLDLDESDPVLQELRGDLRRVVEAPGFQVGERRRGP